ncbi:MAG: ISL3 family transposase [Egibacteraceae bacterium]
MPATTPASPAISRISSPGEATKTDKSAIVRLCRISWPTVGKIIDRVTADEIDPARMENLYEIGVDEISPKKHHNCLTVVVNHRTGQVVWTDEGKDSAALDRFFAELGPERAQQLTAISMDMGKAYPASAAKNAPQATILGGVPRRQAGHPSLGRGPPPALEPPAKTRRP